MSTAAAAPAPAKRTFSQRMLDGIEKAGNKVPHPAVIFLLLIALVIVLIGILSSIASDAGYLVLIPLGAGAPVHLH